MSARDSRQLAHVELGVAQVAVTELRWLHPADDALAPAVRIFDDDLDRLHPIRCATSVRAAAAYYSGQLVTQGRVHALQECGA